MFAYVSCFDVFFQFERPVLLFFQIFYFVVQICSFCDNGISLLDAISGVRDLLVCGAIGIPNLSSQLVGQLALLVESQLVLFQQLLVFLQQGL